MDFVLCELLVDFCGFNGVGVFVMKLLVGIVDVEMVFEIIGFFFIVMLFDFDIDRFGVLLVFVLYGERSG